ncbi:zinc finger protein 623-like [Phycodurus eques]|uniref:zinc finger protein 623-like n=1 Tax=Phycodurus eques TaxID=693459 RepID=UPI002ACE4E81|nr:zinc finger protein 623-like [Phycodurus eques]
MRKVAMLRELMKQRLNVGVEEIFQHFDRTILDYEEELRRTKEEKEREGKLLDAVLKSHGGLRRADVEHLLENPEEVPSEQQQQQEEEGCSPRCGFIKKEEEDSVWSIQVGETASNTAPLNGVLLKKEQDEGQSSQLCHPSVEKLNEGEADEEHCEEPNIAYIDDTVSSETHNEPFVCSQVGFANMRRERHPTEARFSCPKCGKTFFAQRRLTRHLFIHMGARPYVCPVCGRAFVHSKQLKRHKGTVHNLFISNQKFYEINLNWRDPRGRT